MVRIAEGEHPNHIKETNYFNKHGQYVVDQSVSKTMKNCLMYKLSYYKLVVLFLYLLLFNRFFITKTLVCFNLIFFLVLEIWELITNRLVTIVSEMLKSVIKTLRLDTVRIFTPTLSGIQISNETTLGSFQSFWKYLPMSEFYWIT